MIMMMNERRNEAGGVFFTFFLDHVLGNLQTASLQTRRTRKDRIIGNVKSTFSENKVSLENNRAFSCGRSACLSNFLCHSYSLSLWRLRKGKQ